MPQQPGISVSISGLDELQEAFAEIGDIGRRAAMQGAMKKGAELTAEVARALAPRSDDGEGKALADSIVVRASLSRSQMRKRGGRQAEAESFVGATAPHAHLVEFGHRSVHARHEGGVGLVGPRKRKREEFVKTKRLTPGPIAIGGHVPAHPFMRPAFDATKEQATRVIFQHYGSELARVASRYRKQAEKGKLSRGAKQTFRMELGL